MVEDIGELIKKRDELNRMIKELESTGGRFKIKYEHRPNHDDDFRAYCHGTKPKEYDRYALVIRYEPIDGKPKWEPLCAKETREEVLEEIPKIIEDLSKAYKRFKGVTE